MPPNNSIDIVLTLGLTCVTHWHYLLSFIQSQPYKGDNAYRFTVACSTVGGGGARKFVALIANSDSTDVFYWTAKPPDRDRPPRRASPLAAPSQPARASAAVGTPTLLHLTLPGAWRSPVLVTSRRQRLLATGGGW